MSQSSTERGFALVTVLMLLALLMALSFGYFTLTRIESSTTRFSMNGFRDFYAAEGALNLRVDALTGLFTGFNLPTGAGPSPTAPCTGGNLGSGDFACGTVTIEDRAVRTFMIADAGNPRTERIPRGESFQNLLAESNRYVVRSQADGPLNRTGAELAMLFRSRQIPLFQYGVFFDKDLEIDPAVPLTLSGPVHSSGDIYLESTASVTATAQITTGGSFFRGRKDANSCATGPVQVSDPETPTALPTCPTSARRSYTAADLAGWRGMLRDTVSPVSVPAADFLEPVAGRPYWDRADLRVVLDLATSLIEVRNADQTTNGADTASLTLCGAASIVNSFTNTRESTAIQMLEIDIPQLLDCVYTTGLAGLTLDDATDGGLVVYLGVAGPNAATVNNYGVRLINGFELAAPSVLAPPILGLTIATDQALYVRGNYNTTAKKPAALLADSLNVLSSGFLDSTSTDATSPTATGSMTIQAAVLAGTDSTGGAEGAAGRDGGGFNGGLWNVVRLHEDWSAATLNFTGSFVSLRAPRHVNGAHVYGGAHYRHPNWNWAFDDDFSGSAGLPPLTPRMSYLTREVFVEQFSL